MTEDRRKALIFGIHSFLDNHLKVGIQYIAEGLAKLGWSVDYVSIFSSPIDLYGPQRRKRLKRVWFDRQDKHGVEIRPGLREFAFRALFPAHKLLLRYNWQIDTYTPLAPFWLRNRRYNIYIHDITANIVYMPLILADYNVLRLNDIPEGFRHDLSMHIINRCKNYIGSKRYHEIWSAHKPLTQYALELNSKNQVVTIPNGVDDIYISIERNGTRKAKTAIFIGSVEQWVNLELLEKAASLLPDWQFDVIGPLNRSWPQKTRNLKWIPPIARKEVPGTLSRYQVGLIPFRDVSGRLSYVERPLKFFEYIGAGLGVASTDVGALRSGMGEWASYGNTPESFAKAIRQEAERAAKRTAATCHSLIRQYAWGNIMHTLNERLENLVNKNKAKSA